MDGNIIKIDELDESHLFTVRDTRTDATEEAVVVETDEGIRCWVNHCMHLTDVKLQKTDELPRRDGQILCQNHGAMFNSTDGMCTHGPCKGATLDGIEIAVHDGRVILADDTFTYEHEGEIKDEDEDDGGLPGSTAGTSGFF